MSPRRSVVFLFVLAVVVAVVAATPAIGASASRRAAASSSHLSRPVAGILGVIPPRTHPAPANTGPLTYHGGPVMHTNVTYAIYWGTTGPLLTDTYQSLVNGYLQNVAAASGAVDNVYAIATQYTDGSGHIQYGSSYGGSYVDSATPIPDHCSPAYMGSRITVHGCVTDADIQAEVSRVAAAQGWTPGLGTMFFVFTPKNVGSCFDLTHRTCAYTEYCAYHSNFTDSQSRDVLYGAQPHPDTSDPAGINSPGICDRGQHPNGDVADAQINLVSHEHMEAITDPNGDAWSDASGNEIADKCAWMFGTALGATSLGAYNQAIAKGHYDIQQEWSNSAGGCKLSAAQTGALGI